ncbi:MAG: hypothetical protein ACPGN3_12580 [Opitutales bacterium]
MADSSKTSSSLFLFQAFFYGLSACGFLVIAVDLLGLIPGIGGVLQPFKDRFFPEVIDGLGLLITSLVLLGIGALPSVIMSKGSA